MNADHRTRWLSTAPAFCCALVAACGGSGGSSFLPGPPCSAATEKNFVLATTRDWYLFPETLPASVNVGDFATAEELLDALTAAARAQGRDRFFSHVTTQQADDSFLLEGQFIGFGFRTRIEGNRLFVPEVFEDSPAADGELSRGAEITHVDSGGEFVPMATILAGDPNLETTFGPPAVGIQRGLRFLRPGGQMSEAVLTKRVVTTRPVPDGGTAVLALPSNPSVPVGYLALRSFISTAEAPLRAAYLAFRNQGIDFFIVDLRYNGGGLISIAELIGDLNAGARAANDIYSQMRFNAARSANDSVHLFMGQAQTVTPVRIAFITTGSTASASELVVNSMKPWAEVAIVGDDTFGKPVGQSAFDLVGCDLRLRLVTFRVTNADDEGDYYDGLAATLPFACQAEDDLTSAPGDAAESSTAAALEWLGTGVCGDVITTAAGLPQFAVRARVPEPRARTPAQVYLPGIY